MAVGGNKKDFEVLHSVIAEGFERGSNSAGL